ncbi:MAG: adenosylcobalamin-dependent ribonucleoside-diphosphate reductase [Candidatus Omnitrophota bacterium]
MEKDFIIVFFEIKIFKDSFGIRDLTNVKSRGGMMLKNFKVINREGKEVSFDIKRIEQAIFKAFAELRYASTQIPASSLARKAAANIEDKFPQKKAGIEDIQDIVENVLIDQGFSEVARAYILYRQQHTHLRQTKHFLGVLDDLKLSVNAATILKRRYLKKNESGEIVETPRQMFGRVARGVAEGDRDGQGKEVRETEEIFYQLLISKKFMPNSPTLMNAGTKLGQLAACFVLPVEDSMSEIFAALRYMALIHQSGGGTGFSFSRLRPKGDIVCSTMGIASGPVSFMKVFDSATAVIKQGGRRRGANMGILRVDHPDILEFITAKTNKDTLLNFNISVAITDKFMHAVRYNKEYELINPHSKKAARRVNAREVFDLIVTMAWETGEPGLVFIDQINRNNFVPVLGEIEATNPCGEQPLLPYESCTLGSINLPLFVKKGKVDWQDLRKTVAQAVHFLDNVITVNRNILPEIKKITLANRKIGLGVMGFAELLIELGIPYDNPAALSIAEKLMRFINQEARSASIRLAGKRGSFPNFKKSRWPQKGIPALRNATLTTIAPTGTISIIAGCSSGIEPLFAVSFVRNVLEGTQLLEVNTQFERFARARGFYNEQLMMDIAKAGTVNNFKQVPSDIKRLFITAMDISPRWHVRLQAAFQKHTDNAVSKTINLPPQATTEDVKKIFMRAHQLKCKGITVYRCGSRDKQVLYLGEELQKQIPEAQNFVAAASEYAGGCAAGECNF